MSDTAGDVLPADSPLSRYYRTLKKTEGSQRHRELGPVDAVAIRRYAATVGAMDPVHHDTAAARAAGYADVIAPPNFLAAMLEWGAGTPTAALGEDGIPVRRGQAPVGIRSMGGGERMELVNPVVAGMHLGVTDTLETVVAKATRGGPCVFETTLHVFTSDDGTVLNRNRRTVVRRDLPEHS